MRILNWFTARPLLCLIRTTLKPLRARSRQSTSLRARIESLESRTVLTTSSVLLNNLGSAGVTFFGVDANDQSGSAVHGIGDLNGDGFDDFLIGAMNGAASGNTNPHAGESYVVFGKGSWSNTPNFSLLPNNLDGISGFTLFGVDADDLSGRTVGRAGDVNGDGFDDLFIGADSADGQGNAKIDAGETYVVFGKSNWSDSRTVNLRELDGTNGFTLYGVDPGDRSGSSVSGAGDVNGDGYDDLLIGAPRAAAIDNFRLEAGESYLVFGKPNWTNTASLTLNLATLDGVQGITLLGVNENDRSGAAVSGAGDVNGDGYADILIGAYQADGPGNAKENAGESYLIFGKPNWTNDSLLVLSPSNLNGTVGVTFYGNDLSDQSGQAVGAAGDINGDGFADVLISAPFAAAGGNLKPGAGETYVIFGKADWSSTPNRTLSPTTLNGTVGITLFGADPADFSGTTVSTAGDFNGDGFDDILIAAEAGDGFGNLTENAGESVVIFGKSNWKSTKTIDLGRLNGTNGLSIFGIDINDGTESLDGTELSAGSVTFAGDVNGDGYSDVLVSARLGDAAGNNIVNSGESYLIFGKDFTNSVNRQGTSSDDTLTGTTGVDRIVAGRGNDILVGNGGRDIQYGGQGDDQFQISTLDFGRLDGGNGFDNLQLSGTGLQLSLTTTSDSRLISIEQIDIRGSGPNTLTLNALDVFNITGNSTPTHQPNTLTVRRDADDTVNIGAGWSQSTDLVQDGFTYEVYRQGAATLLLEKLSLINPEVTLTITPNSIAEAAEQFSVTANLSEPSDVNVVVQLALSGTAQFGSDYQTNAPQTGPVVQIVIPAGSTSATIEFSSIQDDLFEGPETIVVDIASITNGVEAGVQQVIAEIVDDDNAPVFTSLDAFSVPENAFTDLTVSATDADVPPQTISYSITGGADQAQFTLSTSGILRFRSRPNFEIPRDNDADNQYQVEVSANDGHGGVTAQLITISVTDVFDDGFPELVQDGPAVTWTRREPPVIVLPLVTVGGNQLGGGTLQIQVNVAGTRRRVLDQFEFPDSASIGTGESRQTVNGQLTLVIQLSQNVTADTVQTYLRGIRFSTRGAGLRSATRTLVATLTDINLNSSEATQTIQVRRNR